MDRIKFSLIIGTRNRCESIQYCMSSIFSQTYTDFEVIVIDQSNDDKTEAYILKLQDPRIKYFHVDFQGLSKARNKALQYVSGEYVCLIDDDACYFPDYLEKAAQRIRSERTQIYSGYIWDTIKNAPFADYKIRKSGKRLSLHECVRLCPSAALFLPIKLLRQTGGFDEQLGVGSAYGAAEETDLLIEGYKAGYRIFFDKDLKVKHPMPVPVQNSDDTEQKVQKMEAYYRGFGALYKKHLITGKYWPLFFCFLEIWIKLSIKRLLSFRYNVRLTSRQMNGFLYGLRNYRPQ